MQLIQQPEQAWMKLIEALVLAFHYDKDRNTFTFVCEYPERPTGMDRSFLALVFHGVTAFSRELGNLPKYHRFGVQFQNAPGPPTIVIQGIEATPGPTGTHQEIWLGYNFGLISFTFQTVEGFVRHATVNKVGRDFIYHDPDTGELYDFYVPFPSLQFPTSNADGTK